MTVATEILRHAEGEPRLRACSLFERLAILEDRRRVLSFQRARPALELSLASALDALRPICRDDSADTYTSDMHALSGSDLSDVEGWLRDSGFDGPASVLWFTTADEACGIYCTVDNWFTEDAFRCGLHEVWYSQYTRSFDVIVHWRNGTRLTEIWSDDAVDEGAFFCQGSQRYYASSVFDSGETLDGETVCDTWAELNGYWSDGDGRWRPESDDDGDEDDCRIPAYHDAYRPWSIETARRAPTAYYGLEVELCFECGDDRLDYFEEMGFPTADLTAERDGSLDDDEGLEVISRPFALAELRQHRNPLQQAMEAAERYDVASPSPGGYGVHVTTNAQRLTADHRTRLVDATYDMRALTEFVAGRKNDADYFNYGNKKDRRGDKYTAIHERPDGSFEFRVFRGTPDWQVLLSYVEYVDALTEWTRNPANPTHGPVGQALFRAWVHSTGRYPALSRRFTTTLTQEVLACALPSLSRAA